jgi:hypothetical protein
MPTNHKSIQDSSTHLPDGIQNSYEQDFELPGLNTDTRPVLAYRLSPTNPPVTLEIDLNGTTVVTETFQSTASRTLLEIVEDGVANDGANTLTMRRQAGPGTFAISDIVLLYSQD